MSDYANNYYRQNRARIRALQNKLYEEKKETINAQRRKKYAENREAITKRKRELYLAKKRQIDSSYELQRQSLRYGGTPKDRSGSRNLTESWAKTIWNMDRMQEKYRWLSIFDLIEAREIVQQGG